MVSQNQNLETLVMSTDDLTDFKGGIEYRTQIDQYAPNTLAMYSGSYGGPPNPLNLNIGSQGSGYQKGSPGNIRKDLGYGLQERIDFSGHDDSEPHINYDLLGADGKFSSDALGDAHSVKLFDEEGNLNVKKDDTNSSDK